MNRYESKLLGEMMTLFNRFAVTSPVNYPDKRTGLVTYWTNKRAEQQYNNLKRQYDNLQKEEKKEG